jgi:hypothetical protein
MCLFHKLFDRWPIMNRFQEFFASQQYGWESQTFQDRRLLHGRLTQCDYFAEIAFSHRIATL